MERQRTSNHEIDVVVNRSLCVLVMVLLQHLQNKRSNRTKKLNESVFVSHEIHDFILGREKGESIAKIG